MPKSAGKIRLSGLARPVASTSGPSSRSGPETALESSLTNGKRRASLLPGGVWLWCLIGLAIGLGAWLGGRHYLRRALASGLTSAASEQQALESIDALLRLDANATIDVARGLAHPQFMVASAAYRALGGQLDAWAGLEPAQRLVRMQQVADELDRLPDELDRDHRILVSGLISRIYADALSNRAVGVAELLTTCRRIMDRTEAAAVAAVVQPSDAPSERMARADATATGAAGGEVPAADSIVPPPLPPITQLKLTDNASDAEQPPQNRSGSSGRFTDQEDSVSSPANDADSSQPVNNPGTRSPGGMLRAGSPVTTGRATVHLTAGPTTPASVQPLLLTDVVPLPAKLKAAEDESETARTLSGIDDLSIDQLVRLLPSVQPRVSQAAALALRERGMSPSNLDLAMQLATGSVTARQQLLNSLSGRQDFDARPWLLWMAADGQPIVRQQAVGLLGPLLDNDVRRQLRLLLNKESDPQVAETLRKVLMAQ